MRRFVARARSPWMRRVERAASLVEYALLVALIALACVSAIKFLGDSTTGSLDTSASSIVGT